MASTPSPAGSILEASSPDALLPLESLSEAALCFVDEQNTGGYTMQEPLILRTSGTCSGSAGRNDVRLNGPDGQAGTRIRGSHLEDEPLSAPTETAHFWYHDADSSGSFTTGDPVYVKMRVLEKKEVATTDIRITSSGSYAAGSSVDTGDEDSGRALKQLGTPAAQVRYVDTEKDGNFTGNDLIYLPLDPKSDEVSVGDIRLLTADGKPYTSIVTHGSLEAIAAVTMLDRPVCYIDHGDTGGRSPADPLYLSLRSKCTGQLQTGDIRLSRSQDADAGSRVEAGDPDHGAILTALSDVRLVYIDQSNTATFTREDLLLLQINDQDAEEVQPWDLLLSPTTRGAGTVLPPDDPLIGSPVADLGLFRDAVAYVKTVSTHPGPEDLLYLSPGTKTGESLKGDDVRLVSLDEHPFAGPVGLETGEVVPEVTRKSARICTTSETAEQYARGDAVYLRVDGSCPASVQVGLMRLTPIDDYPGLSLVQQNDTDQGEPLVEQSTSVEWRYHDADNNSALNAGDTLYLDLIGTDDEEVQNGDIRITTLGSLQAGEAVNFGHNDLAWPLTTLGKASELTAYVETEQGRALYITKDKASTHVLMGDVRLSALQAPFVAPQAEGYQQPPSDDAQGDPETTDQENGFEDDLPPDGGGEDDEEEIVPGPAAVALLVVLGVWLVVTRRRG